MAAVPLQMKKRLNEAPRNESKFEIGSFDLRYISAVNIKNVFPTTIESSNESIRRSDVERAMDRILCGHTEVRPFK